MNFNYFDIHSHLYFPDFDRDREEVIEKMKTEGIGTITIGTDFQSSEKAIALAEKHEHLFATVGWHPGDITIESNIGDISPKLEELVSRISPKRSVGNEEAEAIATTVVAIGECGLVYFRMDASNAELKQIQKNIFQAHIDLALTRDLPLMLHIRPKAKTQDAYLDALEILEKITQGNALGNSKLRGNVHFFVGDMDVLKRFLNIGFTVSFTGVITFTHDYDELVRYVPQDMIMSETDSPFVAPAPHRGTRNSPLFVPEVVQRIADLREEPLEEVKKALVENAHRSFFGKPFS